MNIYKITLQIYGDSFFPYLLDGKLSKELEVTNSFAPNEPHISFGKTRIVPYGLMILGHPKKISLADSALDVYEKSFVTFLEKNYSKITEAGGTDIEVFYEVSFTGDVCNFEAFNKSMLKSLVDFNISLLVSTYQMSQTEMLKAYDLTKEEFDE